MMDKKVEVFIKGLMNKTKKEALEWQSFASCVCKNEIMKELENGRGGFDYGVNSIRESASYYLKFGDGYIFLLNIFHGDPDVTSPDMDTIGLMVKINDSIPLQNVSIYTADEQEQLETLRVLIEHYLENKYGSSDALYKFMEQVIEE